MSALRKPSGARGAVAKVKIAAKELALDDGTYRAILERLTGKRSAADCSDAELGRVLDEFKAKGWKPRQAGGVCMSTNKHPDQTANLALRSAPRPATSAAAHPLARKARALWLSLYQLGVVRDPSEPALEAFAKRQLGVDRLHWAVASEGNSLIEALKAMAERAGWSQGRRTPVELAQLGEIEGVPLLRARLVLAQWRRLVELGQLADFGAEGGLAQWCVRRQITTSARSVAAMSELEQNRAMAALGEWIRHAQQKAEA
jgi:phage gp16-like protein